MMFGRLRAFLIYDAFTLMMFTVGSLEYNHCKGRFSLKFLEFYSILCLKSELLWGKSTSEVMLKYRKNFRSFPTSCLITWSGPKWKGHLPSKGVDIWSECGLCMRILDQSLTAAWPEANDLSSPCLTYSSV